MRSGTRRRRIACRLKIAWPALLILFVAGCAFSRESVVYHTVDYPAPKTHWTTPTSDTIMVYRFVLSPTLDPDYLAVTSKRNGDAPLSYHQWSQNPAEMITELVLRDIAGSGLFEKAVGQLSNLQYRYALEGMIEDLRGEVENGKAKAVVSVLVTLTDFEAPAGAEKTILRKRYDPEVTVEGKEAEAVVRGLNEAMQEVSSSLLQDIREKLQARSETPVLK